MKTFGFVICLWIVIGVIGLVGWIMNIVEIFQSNSINNLSGEIILRVAGIFIAPLGSIMGLFV